MKRKIVLWLLIISAVVSLSSITIEECVEGLQDNSYTLKSDRLILKDYQYRNYNSVFSLLPSFTYSRRFIENTYDNVTVSGYQRSSQLTLYYELNDSRFFNYFITRNQYKQHKLATDNNYMTELIKLIGYYSDLVQLKSEIEQYNETLDYYRTQVTFLQTAIASGKWSELDLLSAQIEEKNMELELNRTESEFISVLEELNNITGLTLTSQDEFVLPDFKYSMHSSDIDITKTYEIKNNILDQKESRLGYYQAISNFIPDISVSYSFMTAKSREKIFSGDFTDEPDQDSYSIYLQIPFSEIPSRYFNFRIQRNAYKRKQLEFRELEAEQQIKYTDMINQLNTTVKEIIMRDDKVKLLEKKSNLAKLKFEKGILDFLELKNALNNLTSAKTDLMRVKQIYLKQLIEIQKMRNETILGKF